MKTKSPQHSWELGEVETIEVYNILGGNTNIIFFNTEVSQKVLYRK